MTSEKEKLQKILATSKCEPINDWVLPILQRLQQIHEKVVLGTSSKEGTTFFCIPTSLENLLLNLQGVINDAATILEKDFIQGFRKWLTVENLSSKIPYKTQNSIYFDINHHDLTNHLEKIKIINQSFQTLIDDKDDFWGNTIQKKITEYIDPPLDTVLDLLFGYVIEDCCKEMQYTNVINKSSFDNNRSHVVQKLLNQLKLSITDENYKFLNTKMVEKSNFYYNYIRKYLILLEVKTHAFNSSSCYQNLWGYSDVKIIKHTLKRLSEYNLGEKIEDSFKIFINEFNTNIKGYYFLETVITKNERGETCTTEILGKKFSNEIQYYQGLNVIEVFPSEEIVFENIETIRNEMAQLNSENNSYLNKWLISETKDKLLTQTKRITLGKVNCPHCGAFMSNKILQELNESKIAQCDYCTGGIVLFSP